MKCRGCSESVPAASSVPKYERLGYRRGTPSHAAGKCAVKLDFSGVMGLTWIGPWAGFERKVHIILACPMALDPSADLSSPSVGSPYDSLRIRIPKSESPPGLDLQTDASSAHDFILQFTFQKIKSSKKQKLNPWCKLYFTNHSYSAFVWDRGLASDSEIWYNSSLFCKALFDFRGDANGTHCQGHKRLLLLPFLNSYESRTPSNRHWHFEYPYYWTFDS